MTSSTCCKSTLPVIAQHTQAAYISFQKKKNEMVENSALLDRVPLPSAGKTERKNSSAEDDNEQRPEGSGNLLLSSNWKTGNAKTNFRNVVRAIIRAARWKIPLVKDSHSAQDLSKTWYEEQDTLHFNVNAFKTGRSGNPGLSKRARFVLMKDTWERTDKELELIHSVVNQMKCFVKYSDLVRRELARVMHLETFEDGRIIIQEGHPGFSMYFIVTGSVIVQVSHTDSRTGEKKNHVVGELTAGSSFGELALVQDCKRSATISCQASHSSGDNVTSCERANHAFFTDT
ncbi:unnamed protein product [Clavelina lepadiformis]|uniref:Cyclic nucleotide-binding domain-containing protein n=1 Tax=Clavelina lepadiformis TaxID=159417 RepID=A0ABP0FYM0_CLALP